MTRVVSRENSKTAINLLRTKQPRTLEEFKDAIGLREFEIKKLLNGLESKKIIIRETLSGVEKFWLNENQAIDFWGRNPRQKKRLKHPKNKRSEDESDSGNPAYG